MRVLTSVVSSVQLAILEEADLADLRLLVVRALILAWAALTASVFSERAFASCFWASGDLLHETTEVRTSSSYFLHEPKAVLQLLKAFLMASLSFL